MPTVATRDSTLRAPEAPSPTLPPHPDRKCKADVDSQSTNPLTELKASDVHWGIGTQTCGGLTPYEAAARAVRAEYGASRDG